MEYCDAEYPSEDEAAGDDGWMVVAPSWEVDGPQAGCALLPCEIRWGFLWFQFQDVSDGGKVVFLHLDVVLVSMIIVA